MVRHGSKNRLSCLQNSAILQIDNNCIIAFLRFGFYEEKEAFEEEKTKLQLDHTFKDSYFRAPGRSVH